MLTTNNCFTMLIVITLVSCTVTVTVQLTSVITISIVKQSPRHG